MTTIRAGVPVVGASRALWYDTQRWAAFVDGFGAIVSQDAGWPERGTVVWDSTAAGQGRTRETIVDADTVAIETDDFHGTRTVRFAEDGVRVAFEYELTRRTIITPIVDRLFIRGSVRDSLQRTLDRFAVETADLAD